jgi:hypothetical protein
MNMEKLVERELAGENETLGEYLSQCHSSTINLTWHRTWTAAVGYRFNPVYAVSVNKHTFFC